MRILLAEIMKKRKLSVRQVAILCDIPKSTINDIVNGRTMPRIDIMVKLAAGLKVNITDLYDT